METGQGGAAKPNTEERCGPRGETRFPWKSLLLAVWKASSNKAAPEGLKDPHGPHLDGDANKNLRASSLQAPRHCPGAVNRDMSGWGAGREEACCGEGHQPPASRPARNGDAVRGREAGGGPGLCSRPGQGCKVHGNFRKDSDHPHADSERNLGGTGLGCNHRPCGCKGNSEAPGDPAVPRDRGG